MAEAKSQSKQADQAKPSERNCSDQKTLAHLAGLDSINDECEWYQAGSVTNKKDSHLGTRDVKMEVPYHFAMLLEKE